MGFFDIFRKPRTSEEDTGTEKDVVSPEAEAEESTFADDDDAGPAKEAPLDRAENGPWDSEESVEDIERIDLGALQIPVIDGMELQLEAEESTGRIVGISLLYDKATLQLQAFAAPRTEGLWSTVREQIRETVSERGGTTEELYTSLGSEIVTYLPGKNEQGQSGYRRARFAGVDGPRWFLRGVFGGKALEDEETNQKLIQVFRRTVVNRGGSAMAPREILALSEPRAMRRVASEEEMQDGTEPGSHNGQATRGRQNTEDDDSDPFHRGPEITEVR